MKLYVWTDVLCDYVCGMIVALAPDLETALTIAREHKYYGSHYSAEMGKNEPTVIDLSGDVTPQVWAVYGGG